MTTVNRIKIILIDDTRPETEPVRQAIESKFGQGWQVEAEWYHIQDEDWHTHARNILDKKPDIVLSDGVLFKSLDDGPVFLHTLCCEFKYKGFAYLWTTAAQSEVDRICERFAPLFSYPGSGGFCSRDLQLLTHRIYSHYDACGSKFRMPNPEERCFNPLDLALDILSNLLPLCFDPKTTEKDIILENLRTSTLRFIENVKMTCSKNSEQINPLLLTIPTAAREIADSRTEDIIVKVAVLRDSLLEICSNFNCS